MQSKPLMSFEWKLLFCKHKNYFEKGYALTNYVKYFIAFFGLASGNTRTTLILGVAYAFFCYILGWLWIVTDFYKAEIEIGNRYNLFVEEMRKKYK